MADLSAARERVQKYLARLAKSRQYDQHDEKPAPATADKLRVAAKAVVLAAWTDRHSRLHGHEAIAALDAALNEQPQ